MVRYVGHWRRSFWLCTATAAIVVAACGRAAAQELRVATAAVDDAQENITELLAGPAAPGAAPQAGQAAIGSSSQRVTPALPLARWIDVQSGTVSTRFRFNDTSSGAITHEQLQYREELKARVKVDRSGAYAVNIGLGTGDQFVRGWNNTAYGTPNGFTSNLFVKLLFGSAAPVKGLEIQAGGLGIVKGESTEITSYDNDGYIVGERISVKQPRTLHVDELSITVAYFGDSKTASLWPRFRRLGEVNYYQVLATKRFGSRLASSADVTTVAGATTVRSGLKLNTPGLRQLDSIRFEHYGRFNDDPAYGFSLAGERAVAKWLTLSAGWADIDQNDGGLNSDRFGVGRRWFTIETITLGRELSAQIFYQHAVDNAYALQNRRSLHIVLTYSVLKGLQRTGVL